MRIAPHEERTFSLGRLSDGLRRRRPARGLPGNYSQRDVMQQVRAALRKYPTCACGAQLPSFNIGGGNFEIDFCIPGRT